MLVILTLEYKTDQTVFLKPKLITDKTMMMKPKLKNGYDCNFETMLQVKNQTNKMVMTVILKPETKSDKTVILVFF